MHIGHAKSIMINFGLAYKRLGGLKRRSAEEAGGGHPIWKYLVLPNPGIMVYFRGIIPFYGRTIQVSEILQFRGFNPTWFTGDYDGPHRIGKPINQLV